LITVAKEIVKCKLVLVGGAGRQMGHCGNKSVGNYVFFYGNWNENHELGTGYLYTRKSHQQLRGQSDRIYVALRSRWSHIIDLNVRSPKEDKTRIRSKLSMRNGTYFCIFPKYNMKILFGEFRSKVGTEDISNPTSRNECLHQNSNDNGAGVVNFATSKNLIVVL
jgi:hypothetical protein